MPDSGLYLATCTYSI